MQLLAYIYQFKGGEILDPKLTNMFDSMQIAEAARLNTLKTEHATILQQHIGTLTAEVSKLREELRQTKEQLEDYEYLLCKPMHEIARLNGDFKKTYEEQQTLFADWMISQKAFKELAIQFGFEKGLTAEDTIKKGIEMEIDVLEDKHNPKHNTNVGDSTIIGPRKDKLIQKIKSTKLN